MAVRLPPDVLARVDERAMVSGTTRAATVRSLLEDALDDSGVDTTQIRRALALSPGDRIRVAAAAANAMGAFRGRARQ